MLTKFIQVDGKDYKYYPVSLSRGKKTINKEISRENLRLLTSILAETHIKYGLMFGTLLGAVRGGDFIEHDEDVDIYVLYEDMLDFLRLLPKFDAIGLRLVRVHEGEISLMRKNDYIDINFFKSRKNILFQSVRSLNGNYSYQSKWLEETVDHDFLGMIVPIPKYSERILMKTYGKTWRTPIKHRHALPHTWLASFKKFYNVVMKNFLSNS